MKVSLLHGFRLMRSCQPSNSSDISQIALSLRIKQSQFAICPHPSPPPKVFPWWRWICAEFWSGVDHSIPTCASSAQRLHLTRLHFLEQHRGVETVSGSLEFDGWEGLTKKSDWPFREVLTTSRSIEWQELEIAMVMEDFYDIVDSIADLTVEDVKRHLSNRCLLPKIF